METTNSIKNRRSIRKFIDKEIPSKIVDSLIDAACLAPSSHNSQPWEFVIITDKEKAAEYKKALNKWYKRLIMLGKAFTFIRPLHDTVKSIQKRLSSTKDLIFYNAPLIVVIHSKKGEFARVDCACAAQNMMLKARSLDIGSCWIGYSDIALRRSPTLRSHLKIPKGHEVVSTLVFGYTSKFPQNPLPRKQKHITYL